VQQRGDEGRAVYLEFLNDAHERDWTHAFEKHYGFKSVSEVEKKWNNWVLAGSPSLQQAEGTMLADNSRPARTEAAPPAGEAESLVRGQSPEPLAPLPEISRSLRTQPRGRNLSAPEPNVTAMPQRELAASEMTADLTQLPGQSDWTSSAAEYEPLPPTRTRSADQGRIASAESSVDHQAAVPRPRSDFPQQRERAATTRSDTRLDGAFSP
jgi:hypothetical protein